ncbi:unnamed protein product [Cyprideis torosa]|uniref:Uncharacterized protein n=1 Tax=Cyprideis torosa TaxID=163714 RepID=A0A7R8WA69_9CRUS|nr:unnamed protein product [Cyprideis torosa]CAG0889319.1 unnamed protein product [Cyprideis torosa]
MSTRTLPKKNDLTYGLLTKQDIPQVRDKVIEEFLVREPWLVEWKDQIQWETEPGVKELIEFIAREAVQENLSILAKDDQTGDIAGFRIAIMEKKGAPTWIDASQAFGLSEVVKQCLGFHAYREELMKDELQYEKYNITEMGHGLLVNVSPKFEGKKICQRMISMTNDLMKQRGVRIMKSSTGNPAMVHVYQKNGYEKIYEFPYKNYLIDGVPPVPKDDLWSVWIKKL